MEVKLLLSEKSTWGLVGPYGSQYPSATTSPRRSRMKLWSWRMSRSTASRNAKIALDGIPCASGAVLGKNPTFANATSGLHLIIEERTDPV